jgi:hypothetical protein
MGNVFGENYAPFWLPLQKYGDLGRDKKLVFWDGNDVPTFSEIFTVQGA